MGQPSDTDNVSNLSYYQLFTIDKAVLKRNGQVSKESIYSAYNWAKQLQHFWNTDNQDIMDLRKIWAHIVKVDSGSVINVW